jgi:hypothetical protein
MVMNSSTFWDTMPHIHQKSNDISEKQVAFNFRIEEQAKQKSKVKQVLLATCFMLV